MIEIQCTSCNTRYRIDERVLPDDTPTFKCSRCGHVFSADPVNARSNPAERSEAKHESEESGPSVSEQHRPATPIPREPALADRLRAAERRLRERAGTAKARAERLKTFETWDAAERLEGEVSTTVPHPGRAPVADDEDVTIQSAGGAAAKAAPGDELTPPVWAPRDDLGGHTSQVKRNAGRRGENLQFDFGDDHELEPDAVFDSAPHGDWKVGDEDLPSLGSSDSAATKLGSHRIGPSGDTSAAKRAVIPDEAAFLEKSNLHSASFFLGLFFAVALLFTGASLIICGAPGASADLLRGLPALGPGLEAPVPLESMVSVGGVQASYESIKDGHLALVVSGQAHNASGTALHIVLIGARLVDGGQRELSSGAAYCGNALSRKMLAEMSRHEIEFLQRLDPQKSFVLRPADSAPFLFVFIDPPKGVRRLLLGVTKAVPAPLTVNPGS